MIAKRKEFPEKEGSCSIVHIHFSTGVEVFNCHSMRSIYHPAVWHDVLRVYLQQAASPIRLKTLRFSVHLARHSVVIMRVGARFTSASHQQQVHAHQL